MTFVPQNGFNLKVWNIGLFQLHRNARTGASEAKDDMIPSCNISICEGIAEHLVGDPGNRYLQLLEFAVRSQAHESYLPDALYVVGNNRFEGEQKIRAFYARRRQRGRTTTRHLVDNLRVFRDDVRHARSVGVMSLYRADGNPPFQGARPPAMIADFEAQCVLGDDRLWRFQSHVLRPIFVGSDVPISLSIDPQHL